MPDELDSVDAYSSFALADAEATLAFGRRLASVCRAGLLIALRGDLGAGKTTLSKGLISGLSGLSPDDVTSPTFCLVLDYDEGETPVLHLDAYRLSGSAALIDLGFLEWLEEGRHLILLEWPERVEDVLPADRIEIELDYAGESRRLKLRALGPAAAAVVAGLKGDP